MIPEELLQEYERYAERAAAVEQAFRPRARAAILREYPDVALVVSPTDHHFLGYSDQRKTFITGQVLKFPRWEFSGGERQLRHVLNEGKSLRQRIAERQHSLSGDHYWDSYYQTGFAFERIGAERVVGGTMYLNDVRILQSNYNSKLAPGAFRATFNNTIRDGLNLSGLDKTFVEFSATYLSINQSIDACFIQRVEMPGHDFTGSIYLDRVAEDFIDACEPLLALIEKIEGRFHADSSALCDRYYETDRDWEELGFV